MQLTCPSEDRLRDFLSGAVSDAEVSQISDHVDGCSSCDLAISRIENQQDDVLEEIREGLRIERLLNEPELQQLCDTVEFPFADSITLSDQDQHLGSGKRLRDYRLVKKIGEGGMGTVYQAVHVHLGKSVALKILPADKLRSRNAVDRFRQEMRAVGKVNHPNVVSASDAGTADGQHFLVMELVEGADLARIIQDQGTLQIADACEIVRQAAIGLQHAHNSGLVHRDVKPSNLMLAIDGSVKVLDLGLAGLSNTEFQSTASVVVTDRLTSVGQIMGTLDYMAPEQIASSMHVDGRADIYALGATLFQLLTKRTPCGDRSADTPERIEAVLHQPPLDVASLRDDVPENLCVLLRKMLEKTPHNRPQTAENIASELSPFTSNADLVALADKCRTSLDIPSADVDVTDDVSFLVTRAETNADGTSQAHLAPQESGRARWPLVAVALATLFVAALFAGTVFYIQTDNGTVHVTVKDDSLAVKFGDQNITVDDGSRLFTIAAGEQKKLVVTQDGSDVQYETESFQIRRGDEITFEVEFLEGEVLVSKNGKTFDRMRALPPLIGSSEKSLKTTPDRATIAEVAKAREILGYKGDVTPEALVKALNAGLFAYPLDKEHPESEQPSSWGGPIRLMTSVRGEAGKETLFSPVIDLLSVVAKPNGEVTEESILKLDKKLAELCEKQRGRYRVEAMVAATVFAYQRGDRETAAERLGNLKFYGSYFRSNRRTPFDLNLWLAVRNALNCESTAEPGESITQEPEETIAEAKQLAAYAVKAARDSDDPRVEQAVLRERSQLLQIDRLELAKTAFAKGDREQANEILRTVPGVGSAGPFIIFDMPRFDSDTAVAYKLAELLEEESDWANAAGAYLEAYRGEVRLLSAEQVQTFIKCGRTREFVQTLIEANVSKLDGGYIPIAIVESLLNDENTRADGDQLLKHLWANPHSLHIGRLLREPEIWKQVPDLTYYLRAALVPANIAAGGAGWAQLNRDFPSKLTLLLSDKDALRKLAEEIEQTIEKYPQWKAGPAVLAYLEADAGNHQRAAELIRQVLADAEIRPIPSDSAFGLGMALEGKSEELDRQVMRLYESSLRNRPARVLRESAIPKLARLHAKYGEPLVARQVLYRLTDVDYDPTGASGVYCSPANHSRNQTRCTACHRGKSNLLDIVVMSDNLTDLGYPVDALVSLARIDASFSNAYGSDETWTKKVLPQDGSLNIKRGRARFTPAKTKAEMAITPQAVLKALQAGVFSDRDMTQPVAENSDSTIDLMLSVRGEDGKPTVFSPVIDVLKSAAQWKKSEDTDEIARIDEHLRRLSEANPKDVPTLAAATAFAFLRNDLSTAGQRARQLQDLSAPTERKAIQANVSLWIVARHALKHEETRIIGAVLAERALAAADAYPDSRLKEAIVRERATVGTK